MTVKHTIVTNLDASRHAEVLDALKRVLHMVSLSHVLGNSSVESLHKEL